MQYYLTYNDSPGGVFKGQVADVIAYLNTTFELDIRLVAFVSLRGYKDAKRKILEWSPNAIVVPMVPKIRNWRLNGWMLRRICSRKTEFIFARGPFATALALDLKAKGQCKHVAYDGRGAFAAEWTEYDMGQEEAMKPVIARLERQSVLESDTRLAVSTKLVEWWKAELGYQAEKHIVVPCTLNKAYDAVGPETRQQVRTKLGFQEQDVVLVYSGSTAGWQSFSLLEGLLTNVLSAQAQVKVLFLSKEDPNNTALRDRFAGRVAIQWLKEAEVVQYLAACDYGILVRENTVTNRVAAPTKFAEYLQAGLKVLISGQIGDYTDFVRQHDCGSVLEDSSHFAPTQTDELTRQRMADLAQQYFTKEAFEAQYKRLIEALRA